MKKIAALAASAALALACAPAPAPAEAATVKPYRFANCKALNKKFPHGVGLRGARDKVASSRSRRVTNYTASTNWYWKNAGLDRDKDRIACEKR